MGGGEASWQKLLFPHTHFPLVPESGDHLVLMWERHGPKGWPLLGIWPSGIWSNIFSANMMDIWYDIASGKDSNDFPVDVQNSGRRGVLKCRAWTETIPLWRLVEEGMYRHFWAPHISNVCYS